MINPVATLRLDSCIVEVIEMVLLVTIIGKKRFILQVPGVWLLTGHDQCSRI